MGSIDRPGKLSLTYFGRNILTFTLPRHDFGIFFSSFFLSFISCPHSSPPVFTSPSLLSSPSSSPHLLNLPPPFSLLPHFPLLSPSRSSHFPFFSLPYPLLSSSFLSPHPLLTFEDGADVLPDGDAATAVELTQGQLHVEERHSPEHSHQHVGQKESTWERGGEKMMFSQAVIKRGC